MATKPRSSVLKRLESEVTCPLCLEVFTEPKRLPCDHVYCMKCLQALASRNTSASIRCPECRTDTPVPSNANFMQFATPHQLNRLVEMYQQNLKLAETEEEPGNCEKHKAQPLALYCETCESLVCRDCALLSCAKKSHVHGFIEDMVKKYQTELEKDLGPVRALHQKMSTAFETIATSDMTLDASTEAKLRETESIFDDLARILAEERQHITESIKKSYTEQKKINSAKKEDISVAMLKLKSVIYSTEMSEPSPKFLANLATKKDNIKTATKEAGEISLLPTKVPQREAELLSPTQFQEICRNSNYVFTTGDNFRGRFERSFDPQNLSPNQTFTLHIDPKGSHLNLKVSPFRKIKAHLCHHDGTSDQVMVKRVTPEQYSLSFTPQKRGRHRLHITYNDTHICGSPIPVYITIQPQDLKAISTVKIEQSSGIKSHGGKIYVSTHSAHKVAVLDPSTGSTEEVIKVPVVNDILVTPEHIFATDYIGYRVIKMDRNGSIIAAIGAEGKTPGQFDFPNGIRQSKDREIYVCDTNNHRIQVFKEDLSFIRVIGTEGEKDGCFKCPTDLDFDHAGNIYVVDQGNRRVHVLTPEGQHIRNIGKQRANKGELDVPISVAIHRDVLYITEMEGGRISVFTLTGDFIATFGHKLSRPQSITIDEDGYIYVTSNKEVITTF